MVKIPISVIKFAIAAIFLFALAVVLGCVIIAAIFFSNREISVKNERSETGNTEITIGKN